MAQSVGDEACITGIQEEEARVLVSLGHEVGEGVIMESSVGHSLSGKEERHVCSTSQIPTMGDL